MKRRTTTNAVWCVGLCAVLWALAGATGQVAPLAEGSRRPPTFTDEPEARALLERLADRTGGRPFAAAGTLSILRPARERQLTLRVYHDLPDRWLLRADGRVRERGMRILFAGGRTHVWFPAAELVLELPATLGGERLFGSDFAADDLLVLVSGPDRFVARILSREIVDKLQLVRLELRPRVLASSPWAALRLTLVEQNLSPRRLEFLDGAGAIRRVIEMDGLDALPKRWVATRPDRPGEASVLEFQHVDLAPHFDDTLFTVEGLRR